MNTTSLHIQIEPVIKQQAKKTADEIGLSLSSVVKALLKQFIRTKRLSVGLTEEVPNETLRRSLKQSEEDIRAGRTMSFKSGHEALDYLAREIEYEKGSARRLIRYFCCPASLSFRRYLINTARKPHLK